ncbi:MAG TPA: hypothetical protein DD618_03805 [Acholeplasmatales bacterium]|nr:hypothetical protein [Acholeplasmatales bacterium]
MGWIEPANDQKNKTLRVKNLWREEGITLSKGCKIRLEQGLKRFRNYSEAENMIIEENTKKTIAIL